MIDIYFVILNYNLHEETAACVESIRKHIDTNNYKILIVDNASPNGAGEILRRKYKDDSIIRIVQLPENIGFARGNNVGIAMARKEAASFICCINDDAELLSDNFFAVIREKYRLYKPAVIGPKIIDAKGEVNEFYHTLQTVEEYEKTLHQRQTETYIQYRIKLIKWKIKCFLLRRIDRNPLSRKLYQRVLIKWKGVDPYAPKDLKYTEDTVDLIVSGCCLIFTPVFFTCLSGFNESTFLYYEEEFLIVNLMLNHLHTLYTPDIEIYHKEGISTETLTGNAVIKKWEFKKTHYTESLRKFIVFLKEHEGEIHQNE